jgi:hypothetical protein
VCVCVCACLCVCVRLCVPVYVLSEDGISNEALVQFVQKMEHHASIRVQSTAMEPVFPGMHV